MNKINERLLRGSIASVLSATLVACSESGSTPDPMSNPVQQVSVVQDPAPEFSEPGSYSCDGCPDSEVDEFRIRTPDTSSTFAGRISNALGNGTYTILGNDGSAVEGELETTASGDFSATLPLFCGVQIIKCIWSNETGRYVLVTEAERTDCTNADIQLTLNWDDLGTDFELHMVKDGGRINDTQTDCTWNTCVSTQPDWGIAGDLSDNPVKDIDDTGNFGPENIYLSKPENGTYHVFVEHWNSGGDPMADGSVIFNVSGETTLAEVEDFPPLSVWYVGTINWPSGEVVLDNRRLDCSASWSGGCTLDLPAQWPVTEPVALNANGM